jgi:DNA-binding transcriptional regulator/RsmH inhibitor MraZ
VIHPRLRELAGMSGEVAVFGQIDTLDVWNHERFVARMQRDAFDDADAQSLADLGI